MPPRSETYLHGHHESVLRSHQWRTAENSAGYLLEWLTPGAHVLDVGCGPGTITVDLAARVPDGQVTGIDAADGVLDTARQEAERRGQGMSRSSSGTSTSWATRTARSTWCTRTRCCSTCPTRSAALAEMRRVCRPAGWSRRGTGLRRDVLVPGDAGLWSGRRCTEPWRGGWAASPTPGGTCWPGPGAAGFAEVMASASAWCYAGPADRPWWGGLWAQRLTESPFGDRAVEQGRATRADLERLAQAWLGWGGSEDGWFAIPHGEVLCRA